jgi:hypothetical protein
MGCGIYLHEVVKEGFSNATAGNQTPAEESVHNGIKSIENCQIYIFLNLLTYLLTHSLIHSMEQSPS